MVLTRSTHPHHTTDLLLLEAKQYRAIAWKLSAQHKLSYDAVQQCEHYASMASDPSLPLITRQRWLHALRLAIATGS